MSDQPPRVAERLLRWIVPGRDGDAIAGDLHETYEQRGGGSIWYWMQVMACTQVWLSPYRRTVPDFRRDLHYALRVIRRNPGYAVTAMLCLALGIGVNATVFSLFDGMYFRMLPVPHPDRVVAIDRNGAMPVFWRDYVSLHSDLHAFSGVTASQTRGTFMDVDRANFGIVAETVSTNYAEVLQVKPTLRRWFSPGDEFAGAEPSVVTSGRIWERYFGRDPNVLDHYVRIETQAYRIIGVAPDGFHGISPPALIDAWLPLVTFPIFRPQLRDPHGSGPPVNLTGRLAPGETAGRAGAEIAVINAHLRQAYPSVTRFAAPLNVRIFRGITSPESRQSMLPISVLLLAVVVIVLLIACVNVANLLLSRAAVRQREMALRRALGASRGRLIRQGLAESVILALGGAMLGILLGHWTDHTLSAWLETSAPQSGWSGVSLEMNWRVAAFTSVVALICAVLFSLAKTLPAERTGMVRKCSAYKRAREHHGRQWRCLA